ncbi:MAG: hypothetical protein HC771_23670 [Synechococcales cyanobacterium CRU_2_2]|nr:hypothetical protein [Synechococcales cyanobacterium CRU_2_2]
MTLGAFASVLAAGRSLVVHTIFLGKSIRQPDFYGDLMPLSRSLHGDFAQLAPR